MFKPLHDRVLVRRIEQDEKTKGGIIIPDTAKEKFLAGEELLIMKESDILGVIEATQAAKTKKAA